ncbi:hypothetical protein PENARI_c043G04352 [Penicillium arizonense]|uniref:Uncharacterized protein n=1 Tax=Penicillium arizonense TaxID=1835702 RepID=A0A1F5L2L6_PENAI|nr:hypothetical protein PENARI_c043G04352 [Penicillium arizonense]OGE47473.1 hypothetical protein PENARI_c043G04352 [Penicillium arizonense]
MTLQEKSYEHHIQLVSAALNSAKRYNVSIQTIQLIDLSLPNDTPWRRPPPPSHMSLAVLLTDLVEHASSVRLLRSHSALDLLSHAKLNIHQLDLCSINVKRVSLENFLHANAESIRSLSFRDVDVIEPNRLEGATLTPAYIRSMTDVPVKKTSKLSCQCSFQEGWKLFFDHDGPLSVPRVTKRKRCAQ